MSKQFQKILEDMNLPLRRNTVGMVNNVHDLLHVCSQVSTYPPYNIVRVTPTNAESEQHHLLIMALAGFTSDDINIEVVKSDLTITGNSNVLSELGESAELEFLHKGIAERQFKQTIALGDHYEVHDANLDNGILTIKFVKRLPVELVPTKINITTSNK